MSNYNKNKIIEWNSSSKLTYILKFLHGFLDQYKIKLHVCSFIYNTNAERKSDTNNYLTNYSFYSRKGRQRPTGETVLFITTVKNIIVRWWNSDSDNIVRPKSGHVMVTTTNVWDFRSSSATAFGNVPGCYNEVLLRSSV